MWNEFMEWVDEWDNPIPIPDEDEEDNEEEDEQEEYTPTEKAIGLLFAGGAILAGMAGWAFGNYVVVPLANKISRKKNADKKNETTEWIRANIKDQK